MRKGSISGHQFCQHNHSPSKMSYSFSKQMRFRIPRFDAYQSFYEIPSKLNTRSTGFGYGTKSNIILPTLKNPSPTSYSIESQLLMQQRTKKGSIFGQSRDKVSYGAILPSSKEKYPGPGQYDLAKSSLTQHKFTMKGQRSKSIRKSQSSPGPGEYNSSIFNSSGNTFLSSKKNTRTTKITPLKQKINRNQNLPGPGSYENNSFGIEKGKYNYSKLRDTQKCTFTKTVRGKQFVEENIVPGPGAYNSHSEFQ